MSHEIQDFQKDVIEKSFEQPVVVDFWAEWCGPCRTIGPVLEKLAAENGESWALTKVDVDQNQAVATQYQVRSIPAVKLFVDGQVVSEFTGALPEGQIRHWLDGNLPTEEKNLLSEALALVSSGEVDAAKMKLAALTQAHPELEPARIVHAQLTMFDDPVHAIELVASVSAGSDHAKEADDIRAIAGSLSINADELPEGAGREAFIAGVDGLRQFDMASALERLIESVQREKHYHDDAARKLCVALFGYLGRESEFTKQYLRRFQMVLN
jgi:putative thioredoxin